LFFYHLLVNERLSLKWQVADKDKIKQRLEGIAIPAGLFCCDAT